MSQTLKREHIRFVTREQVEVRAESRTDFKTVWMEDISRGGLFVSAENPPPVRSRLEVRLATQDGNLSLEAEVVHVLDPETASRIGQPPGAGLQFINITTDVRRRIEQYIDGTARRLDEALITVAGVQSAEEVVAMARRFVDAVNQSDLYGALDLPPTATEEEIADRGESLRSTFEKAPGDATPPQAARLQSIARQVNRVTSLLQRPKRRLQYDFRHDQVRAEQRIADAESGGLSVEELRSEWSKLFPDRVEKAKDYARMALECESKEDYPGSIEVASKALELDPFNLALRSALDDWKTKLKSEE